MIPIFPSTTQVATLPASTPAPAPTPSLVLRLKAVTPEQRAQTLLQEMSLSPFLSAAARDLARVCIQSCAGKDVAVLADAFCLLLQEPEMAPHRTPILETLSLLLPGERQQDRLRKLADLADRKALADAHCAEVRRLSQLKLGALHGVARAGAQELQQAAEGVRADLQEVHHGREVLAGQMQQGVHGALHALDDVAQSMEVQATAALAQADALQALDELWRSRQSRLVPDLINFR